ncbi:rho guanine nucleotide exchange factor TIAM2 isoform X2 [Danio rerio]|uniref:SR-related and CTD-associated factor 8 isoform X1 n=3 Tax=Danio rerio TaxID=7955 RepID=A0A286Y9S9_DANRE|nr:T-lymphoma invasion and metastasis-inducing protein 2 isoform X2 [Danio rerio]|eukprot:XP_009291564.1 T-lymphoma invasion and metastasis-inducing protein 2 isoform X2 [Danio rerio]
MGNSESQYRIQGTRSNSFIIPDREKPCSFSVHSSKEDVLSPLGFWNAGSRFSRLKSGNEGETSSTSKSSRAFISRQYDFITQKLKSGSQWDEVPEDLLPGGCLMLPSEKDCLYRNHKERRKTCNKYALNAMKTPERSLRLEDIEDQSSPRVVIKKDGSVRVEFNNSPNSALILNNCTEPVQLLKFSPTMESTCGLSAAGPSLDSHNGAAQAMSSLKSSKGSSLSSDGSLYDLPWRTSVELNDSDNASPDQQRQTVSTNTGFFDEQLPAITTTDLYRDPRIASTFPTVKDLQCSNGSRSHHRSSFVSVMEGLSSEGVPEEQQYSSFTLPCRKSKASPENNGKKASIRSRFRRISDWTGSLTRKKKFQEPRYNEPVDCFDSGVDGLTADTSSPSQVSSLMATSNGMSQSCSLSRSLHSRSGSAGALNLGNDILRQNIYKNFMMELKTARLPAERGAEDWCESSSEETGSSSQEIPGSLEQLDLLFEKEQGVVRRAGWLSFKPLLTVHKDRKLELVSRRKWKQFWVTLKGCTLLFYETYGKASSEPESPCYALFAEDGVVQAVPEHPKKENIFCLSNTYGDVYLFQASSQTDLENWVTAIHSASASLFAKRYGKEDTLRLLRGQIRGLLQKIDMDGKMKKMAELQLSVVGDPKNRKAIENQIQQWEQNLERFNMDLFRMRCYLASLQGGELPNPKSLLATASRRTKAALARLGIFSVSSFHALICSRDEATMRKRSLSLSHRGRSKKGVFSSLKGLDTLTKRGHEKKHSLSQVFDSDGGAQLNSVTHCSFKRLGSLTNVYSIVPPEGSQWDCSRESTTCIYMPNCQTVTVLLKSHHTVMDVLAETCMLVGLDPSTHCLRLRRFTGDKMEISTPSAHELLQGLPYDELEVSQLQVYTLHMSRPSLTGDFGFAVTGYVDSLKNSHIIVSEVLPDGLAFSKGLRPGDEIVVLNGCEVSSLDLTLIQTLFNEQNLQLTAKRHLPSIPHDSDTANVQSPYRDIHQNRQRAKSSTDVSCVTETLSVNDGLQDSYHNHRQVHHSKSVDTVCSLYHSYQEGSGGLMESQEEQTGPEPAILRPCPRHMSATERLRKVIQELVDTEKSYVKDLNCLFEIYLKPLQKETFLTQDEMESLFGSLPEMLDFQKVFLQTLEEKISSSPNFNTFETPVQFKKLLFSLGGSFLYYAEHFKLYSGFCANHIKVQKVLERAKTDRSFKEFLDARNPTKQHSTTLESYLIKPVQRVLKYPLLLRELVSLTDTDSEEHYHLTEALKEMEKVASHINEMQKIYEDYGAVFDQLVAEQSGTEKEVTEISMGQFLMHSSVIWLNPFPSLGRMKKDPELTVFVFKRAVILLYRENNKVRKKMVTSRSAHGDQDSFKFRWLIPLSALQVRLGNTADTDCLWELIHTKSQKEGRPETVFQLCSSTPECKVNIIKVMRSILRENLRRNMQRVEQSERTCKKRLTPLRKSLPASARIGSSRAFWLAKQPSNDSPVPSNDPLRLSLADSDSASASSGTTSSASAPLDPPSQQQSGLRESSIISDEDEDGSEPADWTDAPNAIEVQFRKLGLTEETSQAAAPRVQPESGEVDTPERKASLKRAHFAVVKRKPARDTNSLRRSQVALLNMRRHSHSLDIPAEIAAHSVDLNSLLEKDFSVQSLTSVVNEDFFYDNPMEPKNVTTS